MRHCSRLSTLVAQLTRFDSRRLRLLSSVGVQPLPALGNSDKSHSALTAVCSAHAVCFAHFRATELCRSLPSSALCAGCALALDGRDSHYSPIESQGVSITSTNAFSCPHTQSSAHAIAFRHLGSRSLASNNRSLIL